MRQYKKLDYIQVGEEIMIPQHGFHPIPEKWANDYNTQIDRVNRAIAKGYAPTIEWELDCLHRLFVVFGDVLRQELEKQTKKEINQ